MRVLVAWIEIPRYPTPASLKLNTHTIALALTESESESESRRKNSLGEEEEEEEEDADLREDFDRKDHHPRGWEQRHYRQRQGQDPG